MSYLKRAGIGFIIPAMVRGRKPKRGKKATATVACGDFVGAAEGVGLAALQGGRGEWDEEPKLFLELLRFREMLLWISQVVGRLPGANAIRGIDRETYDRTTAKA